MEFVLGLAEKNTPSSFLFITLLGFSPHIVMFFLEIMCVCVLFNFFFFFQFFLGTLFSRKNCVCVCLWEPGAPPVYWHNSLESVLLYIYIYIYHLIRPSFERLCGVMCCPYYFALLVQLKSWTCFSSTFVVWLEVFIQFVALVVPGNKLIGALILHLGISR